MSVSARRFWSAGKRTAAVTAAAVLLAACGASDEARREPTPAGAGVISRGQAIYAAQCATCHGSRGEGQPNWRSRRPDGTLPAPPHDSSGHTWHHTDAVLVDIVARGGQAAYGTSDFTSGMPAFGDRLTSEEIAAVLAHIKSLWGEAERVYQESLR